MPTCRTWSISVPAAQPPLVHPQCNGNSPPLHGMAARSWSQRGHSEAISDWQPNLDEWEWSSEEDTAVVSDPAASVLPTTPRKNRLVNGEALLVDGGSGEFRRMCCTDRRWECRSAACEDGATNAKQGEAARRAALTPLWSGASAPMTPSKRDCIDGESAEEEAPMTHRYVFLPPSTIRPSQS